MERNNIGGRIETLRKSKGLTQVQLANEMGVKRETVNQWESNTRDLKTAFTVRLSNYFHVSCDYILQGHKAENTSIYQLIGLSDEAIDQLKRLNALNNTRAYSDIISIFLEDENIDYIVGLMGGYFEPNENNVAYSTGLTKVEFEPTVFTLFALSEAIRNMLERGKSKFLSRYDSIDMRADKKMQEIIAAKERKS